VGFLARELGLPEKSLLTRYFKLHATFLLSGVFHLKADQSLGVLTAESGALWFFQINAAIIMVEDAFQELCHRAGLTERWPRCRYLGYIWVAFILFLITPPWAYPEARVGGKMVLLPLRLVETATSLVPRQR
jgi:hypothetical protein